MAGLSATELAARLDVSKARISQYVSEGKLDGCYSGEGRARRFDMERVAIVLGKRLDAGQMLGNGASTRAALKDLAADPAPFAFDPAPREKRDGSHDGALPGNDPDRYELARIQNAEEDARRKRRDNERDEGRWVLAEEVERHAASALSKEIAQFEAVLRDGARLVADTLGVDFREVRKLLLNQWRSHRAAQASKLSAGAQSATMTITEEDASI